MGNFDFHRFQKGQLSQCQMHYAASFPAPPTHLIDTACLQVWKRRGIEKGTFNKAQRLSFEDALHCLSDTTQKYGILIFRGCGVEGMQRKGVGERRRVHFDKLSSRQLRLPPIATGRPPLSSSLALDTNRVWKSLVYKNIREKHFVCLF